MCIALRADWLSPGQTANDAGIARLRIHVSASESNRGVEASSAIRVERVEDRSTLWSRDSLYAPVLQLPARGSCTLPPHRSTLGSVAPARRFEPTAPELCFVPLTKVEDRKESSCEKKGESTEVVSENVPETAPTRLHD